MEDLGFFCGLGEVDVFVLNVGIEGNFGKFDVKFLKLEKGLFGVVVGLFCGVGLVGVFWGIGDGILDGWRVFDDELF